MDATLRIVRPEPLLPDTFAEFGEVIGDVVSDGGDGRLVNLGTARRLDRVAALASHRPDALPNLAFFRCAPVALPFRITMLERHPHSTQAFLPLAVSRFLVCVAPDRADGMPDLGKLRAYLGGPGTGVNFRAGLWHHPMLALDESARFVMLAWEDGSPADAEEWTPAHTLEIHE